MPLALQIVDWHMMCFEVFSINIIVRILNCYFYYFHCYLFVDCIYRGLFCHIIEILNETGVILGHQILSADNTVARICFIANPNFKSNIDKMCG